MISKYGWTLPAVVLAAGLWAFSGCAPQSVTQTAGDGKIVGTDGDAKQNTRAPINLTTVDAAGYEAELTKHRGKVVVVDFWATWCVPCIKNFPHTVAWSKKYSPNDVVVISMAMNDPEAEADVRAFLQEQGADFPNLLSKLGGEEEAMTAFDIDGGSVPHFKVYDRQGKLAAKFGGDPDKPFTHEDVETAIEKALGQ